MKIIGYFAFTLLSILIQFCVMDYIREKANFDDKLKYLNVTSQKKRFNDILKEFIQKPHALYYRSTEKVTASKKKYSDSSLPFSLEASTDLTSTLIDLLYDENATVTEDTFTTESLFTTTELDNFTEITFVDKKNSTTVKSNILPKRTIIKDCNCNLLYKVCDINCCCDSDCTDSEQQMFSVCNDDVSENDQSEFCYPHESLYSNIDSSNPDNLFCVAKSNMPDKRNINRKKHDPSVINQYFKWQSNNKVKSIEEFKRKPYQYGGLLWLLRNGSIYYVDLPSTPMNNYCTGRKPIKFLTAEKIKCNVKLTDLEIFHILNTLDGASLISVTEKSQNNSALNCSTLHCTNWTTIVCDEASCTIYNKSLHEPLCTENVCTNIALKVEYLFNYQDSKIINATIKLHTQKVTLSVPFLTQEINVDFFMANKSVDQIIEFSGNPGYISGLPVVVSFAESNFTDNFYNNTSRKKYLSYPTNKNGICLLSSVTNAFVLFGSNKRIKCRYIHKHNIMAHNDSDACKGIQNNINHLLGLHKHIVVSPYGNPQELSDKDWITVQTDTFEGLLYGKSNAQKSRLYCHNFVTGISLIVTFADESEKVGKRENKILSVKLDVTIRNVTFNTDDISTIVTIDTIFIDETKPSVFEYAGGPHLDIHLPKDFFFPFPSSNCLSYKCNTCLMLYVLIAAFLLK